jgi:hypothetical protein
MVKLFLKLFVAELCFIIKDNRKYIFILLSMQLEPYLEPCFLFTSFISFPVPTITKFLSGRF